MKFIVVGSQVTNTYNTLYEGWDKFPKERADILKFLVEQKIDGVMILSGDRHFTELLKNERPGAYPLYELTCSSLTAGSTSHMEDEYKNPAIVPGTFNPNRNFCTIDFTGPQQARKLVLRSVSTGGEKLWEKEIALSELQSAK